jgi:hypothetical protein
MRSQTVDEWAKRGGESAVWCERCIAFNWQIAGNCSHHYPVST